MPEVVLDLAVPLLLDMRRSVAKSFIRSSRRGGLVFNLCTTTHFVGNRPVGAACDVSIDAALSITHYCQALVGLASMSVASAAPTSFVKYLEWPKSVIRCCNKANINC